MRTHTFPISTGGWNAAVPLDQMAATDAAAIRNLIPDEDCLKFRGGSLKLTSVALATAIETMVVHRDEDSTETLLCAADNNIYTVDTSDGSTSSVGTGFSNNRWQTVNFNNLLLMVNGADTPQQYNGSTLVDYTAAITGATATDLKGVTVFKGRCIYWENNANKFWYAAAGSYGGELTSFPLAVTTQNGGYVVECCTWSRDSGSGADDLFVVLMSTGETLVYEGSDPSTAFDWNLIGRFNLGEPISIRGSSNLAADRIILTKDGFINLSTALQNGRVSEAGNVGSKIINAAKKALRDWGDNYGWEVFYHDAESLLMVNIPRQVNSDNNVYEQYCMNTNTGAWTRFTEWDAITFAEINGILYMAGSDGHIRQCFTGVNDDSNAITYAWIPAFSSCGSSNTRKQATFLSLHTNFVSKPNIGTAGLADYEVKAFGNAAIPDLVNGDIAEWGEADWGEAYWAGTTVSDSTPVKYDFPIVSEGYTLSCKIRIQSEVQNAKIFAARIKYKNLRTI